ncbi:hypothetical protein [Morganella morganii]|uniref:hypothetical protein n=1 Tax=Morganella morganii TaxID=582 RepID=UPI003EB82D7A
MNVVSIISTKGGEGKSSSKKKETPKNHLPPSRENSFSVVGRTLLGAPTLFALGRHRALMALLRHVF